MKRPDSSDRKPMACWIGRGALDIIWFQFIFAWQNCQHLFAAIVPLSIINVFVVA